MMKWHFVYVGCFAVPFIFRALWASFKGLVPIAASFSFWLFCYCHKGNPCSFGAFLVCDYTLAVGSYSLVVGNQSTGGWRLSAEWLICGRVPRFAAVCTDLPITQNQ